MNHAPCGDLVPVQGSYLFKIAIVEQGINNEIAIVIDSLNRTTKRAEITKFGIVLLVDKL